MPSHRHVAESFANGETKEKGSRMFIEGDTIYSYGHHFPIAKRYFKDGIDYLFNSDGYSKSTTTHKGLVLNQIGNNTVLHIMKCDIDYAKLQYDQNIKDIERLKNKRMRARAQNRILLYDQDINHLMQQNSILAQLIVPSILINAGGNHGN